jgi:hypothetical protein
VFDRVKPGAPWYFWVAPIGGHTLEVYKVIRDGAGTLWTEVAGHGVRLDDFMKDNSEIPWQTKS